MLVPDLTPVPAKASRLRIGILTIAALICAAAAFAVLPRAYESAMLLWVQDDPAALAERQLDRTFDAGEAARDDHHRSLPSRCSQRSSHLRSASRCSAAPSTSRAAVSSPFVTTSSRARSACR